MDELIAFWIARLDEDEAAAKAVDGTGVWELRTGRGYEEFSAWVLDQGTTYGVVPCEPGEGAHIARHDPASVLAGVEADRKILHACDDATGWLADYEDEGSDWNWTPEERRDGLVRQKVITETLLAVVQIRAARFSDHPDYRPEWKP